MPRGASYAPRAGCDSRTCHLAEFGRVRKLAKRRGREPRDGVGSTPTPATAIGDNWKAAGYGWPDRTANAVLLTEMRVRLPRFPLGLAPATWCLWCSGFCTTGRDPEGGGSTPLRHPSTRVCSRESKRSPKPPHGVRLLALVLPERLASVPDCTAVFETAGRGSIPRQGSGLCPRSVRDQHATVRRSRTRLDSWRGLLRFDAGAGRQGDRLQSGSKWVRLPPASLVQ